MKRIKIEFQVTLLTALIALAVVFSGYLVYQSLSQIVNSIHREARPDFKLLLIKDVATDLAEVENTVRFYTLTRDEKYFHPYKQINESIQEKLTNLEDYSQTSIEEKQQIDSIRSLVNEKLAIWEKVLALHHSREEAHESFSELYSKIDSSRTEPDTVVVEVPVQKEEKKGFFKRIFGGKKKEPEMVEQIQTVDTNTIAKEAIKQEIAQIEQRIEYTNKKLSVREKALLEQNIQLSNLLNIQITELENNEQKKLLLKTQEADRLAAITYKRLTLFTVASVILLLLVLYLFYRYLNKSRAYQSILRKAKTDAEKLAKAKEVFVATVSHEMRTPINAIYGLTEQLLRKTDDPKYQKDLDIIYNSTSHLISLVNDTLDFSKIESQKLKLDQVDFSLDRILGEVITLNKANAEAKKLQLQLDTQNLPPLVLLGDAFRLKQILINLVNNAIKFTDQGHVTLKAYSEGAASTDAPVNVNFQVIDTGIGISEENHAMIFDDFVQLETDLTKKQGGAGLGLSIVKKLVDLLGGQISVSSQLNQGTTISLTIPYKKGDPGKIRSLTQKEINVPKHYQNLSALIVDDETFNRYLLKSILEKWGMKVAEGVNGQEAVDLASQQNFDLIFMDIRMPVLNGLEASKQILANKESTNSKIIALTAGSKKEDIDKCEQAGMHHFLSKPFTEKELLDTLEATLADESKIKKSKSNKAQSKTTIDLSELKRMANGNAAFVQEMIEIFIRSSENGIEEIQKSLHQKDWAQIREYAHKMAAPAKHIKAMSLYAKIKEMEYEAELAQNEEKIVSLFQDVKNEVKAANNHLKTLLKKKQL
ncbi:response regulator [Sunxiuqinia elliptica]|uniref:histidine kinase n=1 Tax=Sunxiuqinia elliptica TaxID=655355 RepID=A0A4V3BWW3_9BACT|nr:response regulator [Sunxiuqinia elliptica]TDN96208.1 signal transduction histidine kinase [Sunxiuqinia elliptica]TDO67919.1 signal transduction histidine kinase [Sunxiuqinia elliptica]